jgi:hypothetical protein
MATRMLIEGTDKGEEINGTGGNDKIYGYGGNDKLIGHPGNDYIDGGDGIDVIFGGQNIETLKGGKGATASPSIRFSPSTPTIFSISSPMPIAWSLTITSSTNTDPRARFPAMTSSPASRPMTARITSSTIIRPASCFMTPMAAAMATRC